VSDIVHTGSRWNFRLFLLLLSVSCCLAGGQDIVSYPVKNSRLAALQESFATDFKNVIFNPLLVNNHLLSFTLGIRWLVSD
jgi:hypothetical protein